MTEIAQEPWTWILFEEGTRRVLTVVIGGVGLANFSVELTPEESAAWDVQGAAGIKDLVHGIQRSPDPYRSRKVPNPR
jgi:hypothetical protein